MSLLLLVAERTKSFKIQLYLHELELTKNCSGDKFFKRRKLKFSERLNNRCTSFLKLFISLIELRTLLYLLTYLFL